MPAHRLANQLVVGQLEVAAGPWVEVQLAEVAAWQVVVQLGEVAAWQVVARPVVVRQPSAQLGQVVRAGVARRVQVAGSELGGQPPRPKPPHHQTNRAN